jgi:hypothetical protein
VGFRSKHADVAKVKDVLQDLQDNNIDVSQLVELRLDHCQKVESSIEVGSSA